ncbi:hypothetical protein [Methyloversatilis discipulorum]|jgi:hypothetical protein
MRIGICNNTGLVFEGMGAADMVNPVGSNDLFMPVKAIDRYR